MYLGLVFFLTDIACHKTDTSLVPSAPFSFVFPHFLTLDYTAVPCEIPGLRSGVCDVITLGCYAMYIGSC
jgi:hypothetical protein